MNVLNLQTNEEQIVTLVSVYGYTSKPKIITKVKNIISGTFGTPASKHVSFESKDGTFHYTVGGNRRLYAASVGKECTVLAVPVTVTNYDELWNAEQLIKEDLEKNDTYVIVNYFKVNNGISFEVEE